ncbi:MAG: hypothetical protein IPM64_04440 [Phycisphaerales bacterium]|nr:hypothetical protein [Phycisphaerales bacterium]
MIKARCACGAKYQVPDSAAGRSARCKKCGDTFRIEAADALSASPVDDLYALAGGAAVDVPRPAPEAAEAVPVQATVRYVADPAAAPRTDRGGALRDAAALGRAIGGNLRVMLRGGSLATLFILWILLTMRTVASFAGCLGTVTSLIISGWYMAYLFNVVTSGADNEEELPSMSLEGGWVDDIVAPLAKYLLAYALALLPFFGSLIYVIALEASGDVDQLGNAMGALFGAGASQTATLTALGALVGGSLLAGLAFFPMLLLVAAVGGAGPMFRIDLMLRTIIGTLPGYALVLLVYVGLVALYWGTDEMRAKAPDFQSRLALDAGASLVILLMNVFAARTIGLHYYHCKRGYAWTWG